MTTKLGYVTVDCADARSLAPFWASALGWEVTYEADDGAVLADPGGGDPKLFLQAVPGPKSGKNRVHVDLGVGVMARPLELSLIESPSGAPGSVSNCGARASRERFGSEGLCVRRVLSADGLGKRNDDPLGASDVSHPPRALVFADSAHQPVAGGRRLVDGGVQVMNLEGDASQADLVGHSGR